MWEGGLLEMNPREEKAWCLGLGAAAGWLLHASMIWSHTAVGADGIKWEMVPAIFAVGCLFLGVIFLVKD